jgi:hypothetical protein
MIRRVPVEPVSLPLSAVVAPQVDDLHMRLARHRSNSAPELSVLPSLTKSAPAMEALSTSKPGCEAARCLDLVEYRTVTVTMGLTFPRDKAPGPNGQSGMWMAWVVRCGARPVLLPGFNSLPNPRVPCAG